MGNDRTMDLIAVALTSACSIISDRARNPTTNTPVTLLQRCKMRLHGHVRHLLGQMAD